MAEKDDTPAYAKELDQRRIDFLRGIDEGIRKWCKGLNPESEHPMQIKDSPLKPEERKKNDGPLANLPSPLMRQQKGGPEH